VRAIIFAMAEHRIALGCMRLSTDDDRDEARGIATIRTALEVGIRVFDTAHAYARDDSELGHNERLLAVAVRGQVTSGLRVVTKGGMRRPGGGWEPDGRARTLRSDCEGSLESLCGLGIDVYLIHAPDRRVPWTTSVRALAQLLEAGLVRAIGLSNVNRAQLDIALGIAPISAVEVAFGPFADAALRGGVVGRCLELGIEVLVHSPLGSPVRARRLDRQPALRSIAARHGVTAQRAALAAIADLHPSIVPVVGARRPETVQACARDVQLDGADRERLEQRYGWRAILWPPPPAPATDGELVLIMGMVGAGKSSAVGPWVERGYVRMNRDSLGGSMRSLHRAMDEKLRTGVRRIVADNTYATRASRQAAVEIARRHGCRVTGVWLDTPLHEAQHNVIQRMIEIHGRLLTQEVGRSPNGNGRNTNVGRSPNGNGRNTNVGPGALQRFLRDLEPPTADEGFAELTIVPFARRPRPERVRGGVFVALEVAERSRPPGDDLVLVFGWRPGATEVDEAEYSRRLATPVRFCPHPAGPPRCWCRPPLPGLLVEFAERHGLDLAKSTVVGTSHAHASMARAVGARFEHAVTEHGPAGRAIRNGWPATVLPCRGMGGETQLTGPDLTQGVDAGALREGAILLGHALGEPVLLARRGDEVFAIGAKCTHYGGPLGEGLVVGDEVRCPWHHACFSLRTGAPVRAPALEAVACFDVGRRDGKLVVLGKRTPPPTTLTSTAPSSVLIVGAGAAGNACAEALRRAGYAGAITLAGGEGTVPVDRPNLSKDYLAGTAPEEWIPLRDSAFYARAGIELRVGGRVEAIDARARRVRFSGGEALEYGALVLATGAQPLRLPVPGADGPSVLTLRTLADSRNVIARAAGAKRVVIVGAGFIGLEVAASLRARGLDVHVVAKESILHERVLGPALGALVRRVHEEHGVVFHLGATLARIDGAMVVLANGDRIEGDFVVMGVGVRPDVALAQAAGLAVDRGVVVDDELRASVPGIWAAGDVARWPDARTGEKIRVEHWVVAERMGQIAARNVLGAGIKCDLVPFFWSAHYDLVVNYVGHAESWDRIDVSGRIDEKDAAVAYRRAGKTLAVATVGRDGAALEAEAAMERGDEAALHALVP
jgi:NADPH-dependent 2,4-dienoyl-CoA reductase/sulfur reductase-like enzyme/aryl-alcohol dehydrogenase-like predicted oxidoreductase/nitrite reductase/ring-hydroxylating ferredoxin subunit